MQFPDFLEFEPFNQLRSSMGATELGSFEFFDPGLHLTAGERKELTTGVGILPVQITTLEDFTLGFKNSRVLVYNAKPHTGDDWVFHLACCEVVEQWKGVAAGGEPTPGVTTWQAVSAVPQHAMGVYRVCPHCLHKLNYKGFDAVRSRHRQYSQRVQEEFDLAAFFRRFPLYPLCESERPVLF